MVHIPGVRRALLLLSVGLLTGAAAQVECGPATSALGMVMPVPLDLAGHPVRAAPLGAASISPDETPCPSPTGSAASPVGGPSSPPLHDANVLQGLAPDVLHGLPGMDLLRAPTGPPVRPGLQ